MQEHLNSHSTQPASGTAGNRHLWLAVGALAVAVAGLGGTLLGTQLSGGAPALPSASVATGLLPLEAPAPTAVKPTAPGASGAPAAGRTVAAAAGAPVARPVSVARCESCGTVVSVTAVQRAGEASGVGVVAGGVVGGVLGNQIGGGTGRAVATVLGAVGGGWAGNEAEKRVRQTTRYAVRVRMDDGSTRTLEQHQPVAVGRPVVVQGGTVQEQQDRTSAWSG